MVICWDIGLIWYRIHSIPRTFDRLKDVITDGSVILRDSRIWSDKPSGGRSCQAVRLSYGVIRRLRTTQPVPSAAIVIVPFHRPAHSAPTISASCNLSLLFTVQTARTSMALLIDKCMKIAVGGLEPADRRADAFLCIPLHEPVSATRSLLFWLPPVTQPSASPPL